MPLVHRSYKDHETGVTLDELWREQILGVPLYFDRMLLFPTKQVKGRILDPNGKPAQGVEVLACSVHGDDKVYPRRIVRRAKLQMVRPDEPFTIEVKAPGYKAVSEEVRIRAGTPQRLEAVLDHTPQKEKAK